MMDKEMNEIRTYYLIDFENVNSDGLKGCNKLKRTDQIHLFYTDNANKINLDVFGNWGEAELHVHKVPVKSQSLDMHLVSFLGYLIGAMGKNCAYTIVSKDTDYDNIIKFWKDEMGVKIIRTEAISGGQDTVIPKPAEAKQQKQDAQNKVNRDKKSMSGKTSAAEGNAKTLLNNEIQKILSDAGKPGEVIAQVTSLVVKNAGKENGRQTIYRSIVKEYGQAQGLDIYNRIRKHIG